CKAELKPNGGWAQFIHEHLVSPAPSCVLARRSCSEDVRGETQRTAGGTPALRLRLLRKRFSGPLLRIHS
ncbi:MAG: hypothetical protein M3O82_06125, partial [Verrucomicrobiota bacterium]|nr:hypothetical protein [Verrucomicrobiota bacterium]